MQLQIMTQEAVAYVKKNIKELTAHYENGDNPKEWISRCLGTPAFVDVPNFTVDDFELLLNEDTPASTDVQNIKLVSLRFAELNDSFASDERLWAGLAHTVFYDYMLKRWPGKTDAVSILNHFFFNGSKPRCYMVNTISRLWWIGKKCILPSLDDPYALLDYIANDINGYSFTLFGSNWSNSERTLKIFFDAIFEYDKLTSKKVGRVLFNEVMQYMNCLCGIYLIDACDEEFIKPMLIDFMDETDKRMAKTSEYNKLNNVHTTGVEKFDNLIVAINKIGGHGTLKEIYAAYQNKTEQRISVSLQRYIQKTLAENCPEDRNYSSKSKPIFYRINIDGVQKWKVSNDYLFVENLPKRKELMRHQIDAISGDASIVFNIVSTINKQKITVEEILSYQSQVGPLHPEIPDIDKAIKSGIKLLKEKGILELIDQEKGIMKKAYRVKLKEE